MSSLSLAPDLSTEILDAISAFRALETDFNAEFFERRSEVRNLLVAFIAEEHVCMLGKAGVGKSALAQALSTAFVSSTGETSEFVDILLSKLSTYNDVFGPVDAKEWKTTGKYARVSEGYAQSAQILFLDEIWKCNAAVLNSMLTILNEGWFRNSGVRIETPIEMCVSASNEIPEDASLAALYDRFLFRRYVAPLRDRRNRRKLLLGHTPNVTATVSYDQVETLRALVRNKATRMAILDDVADLALDVFDEINATGIYISDRRQKKAMKAVAAFALLNGRMTAIPSDLLILSDCAWDDWNDRTKVERIVSGLCNKDLAAAQDLLSSAIEQFEKVSPLLSSNLSPENMGTVARANKELKKIAKKVSALESSPAVEEIEGRIVEMHGACAKAVEKALGL